MSNQGIVRPLGEAGCTREDGQVGLMDLLARAGLPVPEGFVLTRAGHRAFLGFTGLTASLQPPAESHGRPFAPAQEPARNLAEEALARVIREAVLDLGARTISVFTEGERSNGLGSIPEVLLAVRQAWTPAEYPDRREDLADSEPPTWPVIVQREIPPEYKGWSATEDLRPRPERGRKTRLDGIALHDFQPAEASSISHPSIARLTRQAGSAAGEPVHLEWGLREGRWDVLSASRQPERSGG